MVRNFLVGVLVAILLVAGGVWSSSHRSHAAVKAAAESAQKAALPKLPQGYSLVPYLSDTRQLSFKSAQQVLDKNKDYGAILVTNKGDITLELYAAKTPKTVNNFVFLALHHFYDGVVFHRVLAGFMAQTGDPTGSGRGGPGYTFDDEIVPGLKFDSKGVVAMANAGPNTNGSQFFITFAATPWLNGKYTIFGHVTAGADVLAKLTRINPQKPSVVASPGDTLETLTEQGINLSGKPDETVAGYLKATLGAAPTPGQTFKVDGYTGVLGAAGGKPAYGFYPKPDYIKQVYIITKPKNP